MNWFLGVPTIGGAVAMTAIAWLLIRQLQALRCPAGTFLFGVGELASWIELISLCAGFAFTSWTLVVWSIGKFQFMRDFAERTDPVETDHSRMSLTFPALVYLGIPVITGIAAATAASLHQFCLADSAIFNQHRPWTAMRHYTWEEVGGIVTNCELQRSSWHGSLFLVMRDGVHIDLLADPNAFARVRPRIARALQHVSYALDSTAVAKDCDVP